MSDTEAPISIAFDIGYSAIKLMTPKMAAPKKDMSLAIEPSGHLKDKISRHMVWLEYAGYLTGERAIKNMKSRPETPNRQTDFHGSKKQRAMMCGMLEELGLYDIKGGTLCLSVPYQKINDKDLLNTLQGLRTLRWQVQPNGSREVREITFLQTEVVPQGIGALIHHVGLNNPQYKSIGILEIGSSTIDAIVLSWSRKYEQHEYNHEVSDSLRNLNMDHFFERVRTELGHIDGLQYRSFSYAELSEMVEYDDYQVTSTLGIVDPKAIEHAVLKAKQWFTQELEKKVRNQWGDSLFDSMSLFIISGGGAGAVLNEMWPYTHLTRFGDAFDNVRGQAHAIK